MLEQYDTSKVQYLVFSIEKLFELIPRQGIHNVLLLGPAATGYSNAKAHIVHLANGMGVCIDHKSNAITNSLFH